MSPSLYKGAMFMYLIINNLIYNIIIAANKISNNNNWAMFGIYIKTSASISYRTV